MAYTDQPTNSGLALRVRQVTYQAEGINSYELVHPNGDQLPEFTAGAHIDVYLGSGLIRQYSLCNNPSERHRYLITVQREDQGRGGSRELHETLVPQKEVRVSVPRNQFELCPGTESALLLGAGIGITPLLAMAHELKRKGIPFQMHYCAATRARAAFSDELAALFGDSAVHIYYSREPSGQRLAISQLLSQFHPQQHLYYCGPTDFMKACAQAAAHWPVGTVHTEYFQAAEPKIDIQPGQYRVKLARSGIEIAAQPGQRLLPLLQEAGVEVSTSCESGLCGACVVPYIDGEVLHQDLILGEAERANRLTPCVSQVAGELLVLDL